MNKRARRKNSGNSNGKGFGPMDARSVPGDPRFSFLRKIDAMDSTNADLEVLTDVARNYELKTIHYNQLPSFHGSASEDALTSIRDFCGIVQHFPLNDLTKDALMMRCFLYTLKDAAKTWFMSLTPGSLRTWPEVYNKFIGKFYSHVKTAELRRKIATFSQAKGEPFHEAWERFNMLLIQCPHHGASKSNFL
nr:Retrotransposon gag protein [Ipomoea batatas]